MLLSLPFFKKKSISDKIHLNNLIIYIGCNYTSSFFGCRKAKALRLACSNEVFLDTFSNLGASDVISEETMKNLKVFACRLFGDLTADSVNVAQYNLFKKGKFGEDCLPPNKDALRLHCGGLSNTVESTPSVRFVNFVAQ